MSLNHERIFLTRFNSQELSVWPIPPPRARDKVGWVVQMQRAALTSSHSHTRNFYLSCSTIHSLRGHHAGPGLFPSIAAPTVCICISRRMEQRFRWRKDGKMKIKAKRDETGHKSEKPAVIIQWQGNGRDDTQAFFWTLTQRLAFTVKREFHGGWVMQKAFPNVQCDSQQLHSRLSTESLRYFLINLLNR